jgi:hypothetical protein
LELKEAEVRNTDEDNIKDEDKIKAENRRKGLRLREGGLGKV